MKILNHELSRLTYCDFFAQITKLKKQAIVFTPNPEMLLQAANDREFSELLKKADYLTPDGI
jgi:UDP-N-acetyl-D-mannosaminuronic acid transferase (WecB/TagA/CpsF family)